MEQTKLIFIKLVWNCGDEYHQFLTNADSDTVCKVVEQVQKIENYCTDDVHDILVNMGYTVISFNPVEIDF